MGKQYGIILAAAGLSLTANAAGVEVDFGKSIGSMKPMYGVGQPPMIGQLGDWSMMHYLKEAGVPYSRLHDVGGWMGRGLYVDIPNLFPDFDADESDPENYRFAYTDDIMKVLVANGVEPYFRLGVSIENFASRGFPRIRTVPPNDYAKWARICEHVVRHYTEGWADGFTMKVSHWEIWNFNELYRLGAQVKVSGTPDGVNAIAATDGKVGKLYMANIGAVRRPSAFRLRAGVSSRSSARTKTMSTPCFRSLALLLSFRLIRLAS